MNKTLVVRIALRYLRGKGSANAVPLLSRISMLAVAVTSCAMIVLFSVFNGFESLVDKMYKAFYPDIRITAVQGKFFTPDADFMRYLHNLKEVEKYTYVLEDNILVNTEEGDYLPVTIKGVEPAYFSVNDVQDYIVRGNDSVFDDSLNPTAIVGQRIAAQLGVDVDNVFSRIMVFYPNAELDPGSLASASAFQSEVLKPDGAFYVQDEFDSKYILAPISRVRQLMRQPTAITSVEIKAQAGVKPEVLSRRLRDKLGNRFNVDTRYQQNKSVYMVMRSEKWAGYAILLFVLLIASFNMVSALSLLVLEKQKDMTILRTMGFVPAALARLILLEGILWSLVGSIIGLIAGLLLCWLQTRFKLVAIQGSFVIDAYPVVVHFSDVLVVLSTVSLVGIFAAFYPARQAARQTWGIVNG